MADRRTATSVGVSVETRDALASASLQLGAQIGKRIAIGEVIRAALAVAQAHPEALTAELRNPGTSAGAPREGGGTS
jgi:hypothetical protein